MDEELGLLLNALENDNNNESIFQLTSSEIHRNKLNVIQEVLSDEESIMKMYEQLEEYIYVDEMPDIKSGSFIKWISLTNPENIKLTRGAIVCDILITDNGCVIKCKNFKNKFMFVHMEKALVFRKLNNQEKILISVSNYLNK
jgi:hypothetical protein